MKICSNKECPGSNPQPDANFQKGRAQCNVCRDVKRRAHRNKSRDKWNTYMRKYNKLHKDSVAFKRREKNKWLRLRYGITLIEYEQMVTEQHHKCFICKNHPKEGRSLVVDHHHESKKVRKLLCDRCNVAIAILDNETLLKQALDYIGLFKE